MSLRDYAAIAISTFFLGTNFIAVKVGVGQFPPLFLMAMRFTLVALALVWMVRMPTGKFRAIIAFSFNMGVLHFGLFFISMTGVDASVAAIIFQLGIPFSVLAAWALLGERFGWRRMSGMALAFGGVLLVVGGPHGDTSIPHALAMVASAISWAIATVQVKKIGMINPLTLTAWMALFAFPQLFLASFLIESGHWASVQNADWRGWASILYAAFGSSIIGYTLWYYLIRKHSVSRILPFSFITPVIAVLASVVMLGDVMTSQKIAGGLITLAGVAIIQLLARRKTAANEGEA